MLSEQVDDIGYDPFDLKVMSNPIPYYERMRAEKPVYYTPQYDTFWLARFDDIIEMLMMSADDLISSESSIPMPEVLRKHNHGAAPKASTNPMAPMGMLHNPHHHDIRQAHFKPFMPKAVMELENFSRSVCRNLLDELLPRKKFDLFLDYGGMLSSMLTCKLFDIDQEHAAEILKIVNSVTMYDPERGGIDNSLFFTKLKRFMVPAIAKRRAQGADGSNLMYDRLLTYKTQPDGRELTDDEISDQLTCVFIANTETPGKVAAQGLLELSRRPAQLEEIRKNLPMNIITATEEMLRYCAPTQWTLRTVHQDVVIGGVSMKAGQRVAALIACGNRDEREFENPKEFIWNRPFKRQLAFGVGIHICMGLHISRLQIRVATEEFLKRVNHFKFNLDEAILRPSYFHWAYSSLPVEVLD